MEPIDLYGGGGPSKRALEHAASLALPNLRRLARFAARKKNVGQERRFWN
jgi:hypothetical protein